MSVYEFRVTRNMLCIMRTHLNSCDMVPQAAGFVVALCILWVHEGILSVEQWVRWITNTQIDPEVGLSLDAHGDAQDKGFMTYIDPASRDSVDGGSNHGMAWDSMLILVLAGILTVVVYYQTGLRTQQQHLMRGVREPSIDEPSSGVASHSTGTEESRTNTE